MIHSFRRSIETFRSHTKMALMKWLSARWSKRGECPFSVVAIETTQHCNRRCSYCPVSIDPKPRRAMKAEVFQEIIRQLAELEFNGRLTYHFYNEPLLNYDLEKLVSYAAQHLARASHIIYTNGDLLTEQRAASLFAAGVTTFVVTDHGGRILTDPILRAKRTPEPFRGRIKFRRFTADSSLFNRGGLVAIQNVRRHSYCAYPAYEMVIDIDGNVILCCNDYYGNYRFGNVMTTSLLAIWYSSAMSQVRQQLLHGQFDYPICRACVGLPPAPHSNSHPIAIESIITSRNETESAPQD